MRGAFDSALFVSPCDMRAARDGRVAQVALRASAGIAMSRAWAGELVGRVRCVIW